jgi:hypothetical protein
MDLNSLFIEYGTLAGVAALVAVVINVMKSLNVVKAGDAQTWSAGFNLLAIVGLFILKVFAPDVDITGIDAQSAQFAQVAQVVIAYVMQLGISKLTHISLRGVPIVGTSQS